MLNKIKLKLSHFTTVIFWIMSTHLRSFNWRTYSGWVNEWMRKYNERYVACICLRFPKAFARSFTLLIFTKIVGQPLIEYFWWYLYIKSEFWIEWKCNVQPWKWKLYYNMHQISLLAEKKWYSLKKWDSDPGK